MKHTPAKRFSNAKKGLALTTAIAAAAGLAGAALLYLRRRGIDTERGTRMLGGKAKKAGRILSQEAKQAYGEIRDIIIEEAAAHDRVTKTVILATIKQMLGTFKRRGSLTKDEFEELAAELKDDWESLEAEARERQESEG
ncbi:MAG: hypothetical protein HY340_03655 [Candidatus Kerfeldbacteria bacterium]|nr:hypothetical protein [Candidatus Kerfeldbacteria bacterium]